MLRPLHLTDLDKPSCIAEGIFGFGYIYKLDFRRLGPVSNNVRVGVPSCQLPATMHRTCAKLALVLSFAITFALAFGQVDDCVAEIVAINQIQFVGTATEFYPNENRMIDGSGLIGTLNTDADFATVQHRAANPNRAWVTNAPGGFPADYFAVTNDTVAFDLTLADSYTLESYAHWGYHFNQANGNTASEAVLQFSDDGGATFQSSQTVNIALTTFNASVSVLDSVEANFIRITYTDNYFGTARGGDRLGVSEIRFGGTISRVPEPTSGLSLLLALATVASWRRRSR